MAYVEYADSTTSTTSPMSWFVNFVAGVYRTAISLLTVFSELFGWQASPQDHLHLHRAARQINTKPANAIRRSKAFRARGLLHDLFTGTGFAEPSAVGSA